MQKKIIALAVAGLVSGAAFAQSNVTIYGVMDAGQAWVKTDNRSPAADQNTVGRLDTNSSYIGFKGTEDLGNGLKAVFLFENTVSTDVGGWGAARDAYVGLASNYGTLVMGNLTHPLRTMGSKVDQVPAAAGFGTMASLTGVVQIAPGVSLKTGADDRANNAIAYISPNFSGFTVIGAYVNGWGAETEPNGAGTSEANQYQIAATYENGPLWLAAGYHEANNLLGASSVDAEIWRLAAQYSFSTGTQINFLYDDTNLKLGAGAGTSRDRSAWSLGVNQTFGAHNVGLEYADAGKSDNVAKSSADMWSLTYGYNLSKRTMIHARYSVLDNDNGAGYTFYNNPVANPVGVAAGGKTSGYMVGLRHTF